MLVLHALWIPGKRSAAVWAEDSEATITSPSQALRQARPHPFAATTAALEALVPGTPSTATVLLPSLRKAPLDSPVLFRITPRRQAGTRPSALEWRVPVLMLDPAKVETSLAPPRRPRRS